MGFLPGTSRGPGPFRPVSPYARAGAPLLGKSVRPDAMPQAIRVTEAEGRSCIYVPVTVNWKAVNSKRFTLEP